MKILSDDHAKTLITFLDIFLDAFDPEYTDAGAFVEECMREDFGIENPRAALAQARGALS